MPGGHLGVSSGPTDERQSTMSENRTCARARWAPRAVIAASSVALMISGLACDQAPPGEIETTSQDIYHGTAVADVAGSGVVRLEMPGIDEFGRFATFTCSGTVYSRYWILTSAHCFSPA